MASNGRVFYPCALWGFFWWVDHSVRRCVRYLDVFFKLPR